MGYQPRGSNSITIDASTIKNSTIQQSIMDHTIAIAPGTKVAGLDYDNIFNEIAKRFNKVPTIEHKCHNCGGTLEMDANNHIFNCPYCNSVYAVGVTHINDKG